LKVLVTGAFGTLGVAVCRELSRRGHGLAAMDLPSGRNRKAAARSRFPIRVFWGDVREPVAMEEAICSSCADVVLHCAAILAPASEADPVLSRGVNVGGTEVVLEACARAGAGLVYPSSVTVYGPGRVEGPPRTAEDPLVPTDSYSGHKAECERMIRESGVRWSIMRLGVSVDPAASQVSADVLRAMFEISPETRMEYVHPADVATAFANLLEAPEAWGRVLLIGGGERCRIRQRDLFDAVFTAAGIGPLPAEAFGDAPYYTDWMDTTESQRLLRYQRHTFDDFRAEAHEALRLKRPLVRAIRPIARWYLLSHSGPWRGRRR